jgi:hypothetical protein
MMAHWYEFKVYIVNDGLTRYEFTVYYIVNDGLTGTNLQCT